MKIDRIVEYVFFFGFLVVVGYLLWLMFAPFISALALAAIIVTICYPIYEKIQKYNPTKSVSVSAFLSTILVLIVVIIPLIWITSMLFTEAVSIYHLLDNGQVSIQQSLTGLETYIQNFIPTLQIDLVSYLRQGVSVIAGNLGVLFSSTASTVFSFFIALIGSFYLFRDGKKFTKALIRISPLPQKEDELILKRMATAVRSVATGTLLVALIQGVLTAIGFTIFGFERAVLFGTVASIGALIPSVGTSIVFVPAIIYLLITGSYFMALGLLIWAVLAVGLIDNLLGPYFMSRGNTMHPFLILLSVLGGIGLFGPIGFIVGPVLLSLFIVLLEIYATHISDH